MKPKSRHPIWSWVIHTPWVLAVLGILGLAIFFGSGAGNPLLQRLLISRLERATGGKVELRGMSIRWLAMRLTLTGLVIHGNEPAGTEPLFTADEVQAGLRIDSVLGRRVSLNELLVQKPHIHILVGRNGATNVPSLPRSVVTNRRFSDTLFKLHVRRVLLEDGWILYNDVKTPIAVHGGDLQFSLEAGGTLDHPLYLGNAEWQTVQFTSKRYVPLAVGLTAKFTLWRDGFALEQGVFNAGHSRIDAQAEMSGFANPKWSFRYRGWVELLDFRETLRDPYVPTGRVDLRGEGQYAAGHLNGSGSYAARDIDLPYEIFHAKGLTSRSSYRFDNVGLEMPDFSADAFGGRVTGHVGMRWEGWKFQAETHVGNMRLAPILPCIEHRDFPIDELHWDARITADSVETWTGAFLHFETSARTVWDAPEQTAEHHLPVRGTWNSVIATTPALFGSRLENSKRLLLAEPSTACSLNPILLFM